MYLKKYRLAEGATVYSTTNRTSTVVAELQTGDEITVGESITNAGEKWDAVTLLDGRTGYISGKTKGRRTPPSQVEDAELQNKPSARSQSEQSGEKTPDKKKPSPIQQLGKVFLFFGTLAAYLGFFCSSWVLGYETPSWTGLKTFGVIGLCAAAFGGILFLFSKKQK